MLLLMNTLSDDEIVMILRVLDVCYVSKMITTIHKNTIVRRKKNIQHKISKI
jgi:hypothetical protein